jgi:hypothetical protein
MHGVSMRVIDENNYGVEGLAFLNSATAAICGSPLPFRPLLVRPSSRHREFGHPGVPLPLAVSYCLFYLIPDFSDRCKDIGDLPLS